MIPRREPYNDTPRRPPATAQPGPSDSRLIRAPRIKLAARCRLRSRTSVSDSAIPQHSRLSRRQSRLVSLRGHSGFRTGWPRFYAPRFFGGVASRLPEWRTDADPLGCSSESTSLAIAGH